MDSTLKSKYGTSANVALPVAFPLSAYPIRQREAQCTERKRPVVQPAVILKPSRVIRVLMQVLRTDAMMLANHHAPQAS